MEISDTSEEAVNINETTTEPVEETKRAEKAENTDKLGNTIMVYDIFIFFFGCGESAVLLRSVQQNKLF